MENKELIEYLQGFPEDTNVDIVVLDCSKERKYAFFVERLGLITDEDHPIMLLDIDRKKAEDVTREEGEDEELGS